MISLSHATTGARCYYATLNFSRLPSTIVPEGSSSEAASPSVGASRRDGERSIPEGWMVLKSGIPDVLLPFESDLRIALGQGKYPVPECDSFSTI